MQMCSVYQTTVIAIFRFVAVQWPFHSDHFLTHKNAIASTMTVVLMSLLAHISAVLGGIQLTAASTCKDKYKDNDIFTEDTCITDLYYNHMSVPYYYNSTEAFMEHFEVYHVIVYHIILFLALPFTLLLILNIAMLRNLYNSSFPHDEQNRAVTKVVVGIVTVFLITYVVKPLYITDVYFYDG